MDEMERQNDLPSEEKLPAEVSDETTTEIAEEEQEQPSQPMYFGRFTPGVWRGGVLGIALSYIFTGLFGVMSENFGLGLEPIVDSPIFKYGLVAIFCFGGGKIGSILEKRAQQDD